MGQHTVKAALHLTDSKRTWRRRRRGQWVYLRLMQKQGRVEKMERTIVLTVSRISLKLILELLRKSMVQVLI